MDEDTLLNAVHVATDAGRYAEALEWILQDSRRLGRWISHDAGCYPIVAILDDRLARSSCATTAHPAASRVPNCVLRHHRRSRTHIRHHPRTLR